MIRVRTYENALRAVNAPGVRAGSALPSSAVGAGESAETRTLNAVLGSGMKLAGLAAERYAADEAVRVSQAIQRMNADLAAERDRYMQENQGESAVEAETYFGNFAASLAQKYLEEEKFQGRAAEAFRRRAAGGVLHFAELGRSYGNRQREAWNRSVLEGAVSEFQRQAAENYDDRDWLEYGYADLERTVNAMRPGQDNAAILREARAGAVLGAVRGHLEHGDTEGAGRTADAYREELGEGFGRVQAAIRGRAQTLREKRAAEQARLGEDEKKAQVENLCRETLAQMSGLPEDWSLERRTARMERLTEGLGKERRDRVRTILRGQLREEELSRRAGVVQELNRLEETFRASPDMPLADRLTMIRTGDFREETKRRAEEELVARSEGRGDDRESALCARRLRAMIDASGGGMDGRELSSLMLDFGLNGRDRAAVTAYAASSVGLQRRVDGAVDAVFGEGAPELLRSKVFTALCGDRDIRSGSVPDDEVLKRRVSALKGMEESRRLGGFNGAEDTDPRWRPELSEGLSRMLDSELAESAAYRSASGAAKKLMRQMLYLRRYLGQEVSPTRAERRLLESAGEGAGRGVSRG